MHACKLHGKCGHELIERADEPLCRFIKVYLESSHCLDQEGHYVGRFEKEKRKRKLPKNE
jgi:hypothetical protein